MHFLQPGRKANEVNQTNPSLLSSPLYHPSFPHALVLLLVSLKSLITKLKLVLLPMQPLQPGRTANKKQADQSFPPSRPFFLPSFPHPLPLPFLLVLLKSLMTKLNSSFRCNSFNRAAKQIKSSSPILPSPSPSNNLTHSSAWPLLAPSPASSSAYRSNSEASTKSSPLSSKSAKIKRRVTISAPVNISSGGGGGAVVVVVGLLLLPLLL